MCYYKLEPKICSETTISTVNSLHICWNLDVTFILCQVHSHGDIQGQCPKFFVPRKVYFFPQNLATGLLYASLHFQTCGILIESANVSDFSPHSIFAVR